MLGFGCEENNFRSQPLPRGVLEICFGPILKTPRSGVNDHFLHMDPEIHFLLANAQSHDSDVIPIVGGDELRAGRATYHAMSSTEARERAN